MSTPGTPLARSRWRCSCSVRQAVHWLDLAAAHALDAGGEAAVILGEVAGHFLVTVRRSS